MTNDNAGEVIDFIEKLKKRTLPDGTKVMGNNMNMRMLYKEYFIQTGKTFFTFEKGIWKILESFAIFVKKGRELNYVEENFKEFKERFGGKQ
jgi:hypothetical protein